MFNLAKLLVDLRLEIAGDVYGMFSLFSSLIPHKIEIKCLLEIKGVLLRILCGGVLPGSQNPDPIADQRMSFFTPVCTDLVSKIHNCFQTWRLRNYVMIA